MSVLTRRDRTVSFRLSEKEYQALYEFCRATGARSVSDFARTAVRRAVGTPSEDLSELTLQIEALNRQHGELSKQLSVLSGRVNAWGRHS